MSHRDYINLAENPNLHEEIIIKVKRFQQFGDYD